MLDYIYRPIPTHESSLGMIVHTATTRLPNAKSILWRAEYLAKQITHTFLAHSHSRILSVASGHMRELDRLPGHTSNHRFEIWAFDQDQASLDECVKCYSHYDITTICKNISFLLRRRLAVNNFHLIYTAGLSDYLSDNTLKELIKTLYYYLSPDGLLTLGNFTSDSHGRGFMEAFMDWTLIYRTEHDLIRIVEEAVPSATYEAFRDEPGNVAYIEIRKRESV